MKLFPPGPANINRRRAFTMVEFLIASGVGTLLAGAAMMLMLETTKESLRALADYTVEQQASDLEHKIVRYLRGMSANEGVIFFTPSASAGYPGYCRIIVARGPAPDFPREELWFDPDTKRVSYRTNRSQTASEQVVMRSRTNVVVLRNLCFFPSVKSDGALDNSLVNVVFDLDEDGASRRQASTTPARIQRTFAVKMRNN